MRKSLFVLAIAGILGFTSDRLSAAPAIKIMALGDSITTGCTDPPAWTVPFTFGYRGPLYTKLTNAHYNFQFVGASPDPWNWAPPPAAAISGIDLRIVNQDHHRGTSGFRIHDISMGVVGWLNADNPDVILLMIGTNDMGQIFSGNMTLAMAKTRLNDLVQTIVTTKPEAKLIVAQITPVLPYSSMGALIGEYNGYIKNELMLAYAAQGNVSTVDQYSAFLTNPGDPSSIDATLLVDTCHPNQAGYARMAQVWFDGIQAATVPEPSASSLLTSLGLFVGAIAFRRSRHKDQL